MNWSSTATVFLFLTRRLLAQKSEVTCSSSFDWAKNSKGQDPCLVAALLQADCRNGTNVTVPKLAVNEIYPGPDPANTHDVCACNSIVYSLLCTCAACQGRFCVDWTSWTEHCAMAYLEGFPKDIPSDINVPLWAYNKITMASAPSFDMGAAIKTAITGSETSSSRSPSYSTSEGTSAIDTGVQSIVTEASTSSGPSFTTLTPPLKSSNLSNETAADNQFGIHRSLMIVGAVVGSTAAVVMASLAVWCLLRRSRRREEMSSAASSTFYKPLVEVEIPREPIDKKHQPSWKFSPLELDITSRYPGHNGSSALDHGQSKIDLPNYLFHASPDSEHVHSPAVESSELFATVGGHSSSEGYGPDRRVSAQSSGTSARVNPFGNRRGASRGSTLLSSRPPSPVREEPQRDTDSRSASVEPITMGLDHVSSRFAENLPKYS